jgi:hypothetical protein
MTQKNILRSVLALFLAVVMQTAFAQGDIILTVKDSSGASINYDLAALEALVSTTLDTHTSWTDGPQRFTGVRASVLLAALGTRGATVRSLTLNNYETSMSVKEITDYPVIIAYKRNGEYMSIRNKGPLWVIFPLKDFPELDGLETDQKMAWNLRQLIVE